MALRSLAAPFVLIVSATGCTTTTTQPGPGGTAPSTGSSGPSAPRIERQADGTCLRFIDVVCHEGATCNPPEPERVDCDTGQPIVDEPRELPSLDAAPEVPTSRDRPERVDPATLPKPSGTPGVQVLRRADGTCVEVAECPPGESCLSAAKPVQCP